MMRSAFNVASLCIFGTILLSLALMVAYFVSPQAVRTAPPASNNSLLLERLSPD
ncbi:hypothetical protein [Ruegeria sp.]|uniref:hypothetical protein n=1 Tax=Ruegeria sp. TaxID=1879320 RepID=UPI003B59B3F6